GGGPLPPYRQPVPAGGIAFKRLAGENDSLRRGLLDRDCKRLAIRRLDAIADPHPVEQCGILHLDGEPLPTRSHERCRLPPAVDADDLGGGGDDLRGLSGRPLTRPGGGGPLPHPRPPGPPPPPAPPTPPGARPASSTAAPRTRYRTRRRGRPCAPAGGSSPPGRPAGSSAARPSRGVSPSGYCG